jgi:peptide subunit release factor 1 (eRF1)
MQTIERLDSYNGNGTSMITLTIAPSQNALIQSRNLLQREAGTATNIKSRV